ncbi:MAG TPA: carboxypeptidase-like regulatory domain-containing protein, partial [Mucilaginibacter sp.]|nr:carboxypeptidase-like regulatory domain-containing protein [Mucilaginibacter sp.]
MDRITLTLLLVFLLHLYCAAQFSIKGRVLSADKSTPIAGASIFFNHASFGAATNEDGLFHFSSVKSGQYELVVSAIGYEAQVQNLLVDNDVTLADIVLKPKSIGLKEVKIRPGFDREKYYQIFKQRFLGLSDNARQCQILNPDILDIDYDSHKLTVGADQILLIENKILGYKIKYLLKDFTLDGNDGTL